MGQKVNPTGFRLVTKKKWGLQPWLSVWYAGKKNFANWLVEDRKIREFLVGTPGKTGLPACKGVSRIRIQRKEGEGKELLKLIIETVRPGIIIGKGGAGIEEIKMKLDRLLKQKYEISIDTVEIKPQETDAQFVADSIASQLERRIPFRRAVKKSIQTTMGCKIGGRQVAQGVKIMVAGRLGGAEIARTEWYKEGTIPLHTFRANIDYAQGRAETTYGSLGIKVWICRGEVQIPQKKNQTFGGR